MCLDEKVDPAFNDGELYTIKCIIESEISDHAKIISEKEKPEDDLLRHFEKLCRIKLKINDFLEDVL